MLLANAAPVRSQAGAEVGETLIILLNRYIYSTVVKKLRLRIFLKIRLSWAIFLFYVAQWRSPAVELIYLKKRRSGAVAH